MEYPSYPTGWPIHRVFLIRPGERPCIPSAIPAAAVQLGSSVTRLSYSI